MIFAAMGASMLGAFDLALPAGMQGKHDQRRAARRRAGRDPHGHGDRAGRLALRRAGAGRAAHLRRQDRDDASSASGCSSPSPAASGCSSSCSGPSPARSTRSRGGRLDGHGEARLRRDPDRRWRSTTCAACSGRVYLARLRGLPVFVGTSSRGFPRPVGEEPAKSAVRKGFGIVLLLVGGFLLRRLGVRRVPRGIGPERGNRGAPAIPVPDGARHWVSDDVAGLTPGRSRRGSPPSSTSTPTGAGPARSWTRRPGRTRRSAGRWGDSSRSSWT